MGLLAFPRLNVCDGALQSARQIDMEQRPVETLHDSNFATMPVGLAVVESLADIGSRTRDVIVDVGDIILFVLGGLLDVIALLPLISRCAVLAANLGDTEDGLPRLGLFAVFGRRRGWVAESCAGESTLGPSIVDVSEVPINFVWGGIFIKLVANID